MNGIFLFPFVKDYAMYPIRGTSREHLEILTSAYKGNGNGCLSDTSVLFFSLGSP